RDFQAVFDEELAQLSDRLRRPLVLCYLQGATRDEAARSLGLRLGTLKRRLESARQELRLRLRGRGVEFAFAGAAVALTDYALSAAAVNQTVQLSLALARTGVVPPALAPLLEGVTPMSFRTWKILVAVLVVMGGLVGGVGLLRPKAAPPGPASKP